MKKNIIVIGGSSDIAQSTISTLSNEAYNFYALVRDQDKSSTLIDLGVNVTIGDATSEEDIKNFVSRVKEVGDIFAVLHTVGSFAVRPPHAMNKAAFEAVISTNLTSAFLTLSIAGKAMLGQGHGRMIFTSSVAGSLGLVNHEAISAAKAGIEGFARSAAATYAKDNLRVNVVAPSIMDSNMSQKILSTEAAREVSKNMHPISKIGDSDDILPVIKWLLSPDAKWVTGQTIHVDGGLSTVKPR